MEENFVEETWPGMTGIETVGELTHAAMCWFPAGTPRTTLRAAAWALHRALRHGGGVGFVPTEVFEANEDLYL